MGSPSKHTAPINLSDVARHAGVSRATASLVLRESPLVASATRERVHQAVDALGYIYNRGAANLRARRTKTIGLLVSNVSNPFFTEMTIGVDATLDKAGYVAFLANTAESLDRQERFLKRMREQNVDGVVLCAVAGTPKSVLRQLGDWKMPCVQTLRSISSDEGDYVGSDYQLGLEQITEHLIRLGHKRIALVGSDQRHSAMFERRAGFICAMQRHRLSEDLILSAPPTRQAGLDVTGILLDRPDPPTAAVCYNDTVAFGLMVGLQRRGLQPGRDFAVTGVDDVPEAAISFPSLTTVATLPRRLGEAAAELLLQRIENPDGAHERIVLPTRLLVRESSGGYLHVEKKTKRNPVALESD